MDAESILDVPLYSPTLVARLVGLSPTRVRRWLRGYEYTYVPARAAQPIRRRQHGIVSRAGAASSSFASFLDLIDLLFVKKFVERGISIQRLRQALSEANEILGAHHFAQRRFWTDGREIFLEVNPRGSEANALLHLLAGGQWAIAPVIKSEAKQIDFNEVTGVAERWFPLGKDEPVVVDPRYGFGSPSLVRRGVETANVFDLFNAEGRDVERVCRWMNLEQREVNAAVRFEEMLAAAA